jgi:aspartyl protease family protein
VQEFPRSLKLITIWLVVGVIVFLGVQAWQHQAARTRFQIENGTIVIERGGRMATTTGPAASTVRRWTS